MHADVKSPQDEGGHRMPLISNAANYVLDREKQRDQSSGNAKQVSD